MFTKSAIQNGDPSIVSWVARALDIGFFGENALTEWLLISARQGAADAGDIVSKPQSRPALLIP